jgi:SAM-dependent methyltransferase
MMPKPVHSSAGESFRYSGTELDAMAEARNYHRWILAQFAPFLGDSLLEVGAGIGNFAAQILEARPDICLTLLEPAANLAPLLAQRFASRPRVRTLAGSLAEHAASLSVEGAVMVNVLEHIENDQECLFQLHRVLRPGGRLMLFVPAVQAIYGSLDAAFDHFRRYSKPGLRRMLEQSGFTVKTLRYVNMPGVMAWWVTGTLLRRTTLRPASVRAYDRWVVPWLAKLEDVWEPPIGQSLLAVAER